MSEQNTVTATVPEADESALRDADYGTLFILLLSRLGRWRTPSVVPGSTRWRMAFFSAPLYFP